MFIGALGWNRTDIKALEEMEDINAGINAVYEKINMHTQIPFDE